MKNLYNIRFWLLLLLGLSTSLLAQATHTQGGHITYRHLAGTPYRYRVDALQYVDASSPASTNRFTTIVYKRNSCAFPSAGSYRSELEEVSRTPVSLSCAGPASLLAVRFVDTITLAPGQWTITIDEANRGFNSNLVDPTTKTLHLEAFLDNTLAPADASPQFTTVLLPQARLGQLYRYAFAAFDADGDSLAYTAITPQYIIGQSAPVYPCPNAADYLAYSAGSLVDPATGQSVAYPAGQLSATLPLPSFRLSQGNVTPYAELDASGNFTTIPVQVGTYAVAVRVDEYRRLNGNMVKIGSVMREVPYSVLNYSTPNTNPTLSVAHGSTTVPANQPIEVQPGQNLTLTFTGSDPDAGQMLRLSSDVAAVLPGATFQPNLVTPTALFNWPIPLTTLPGTYTFSVAVTDNACPLNGSEVRAVTLRVAARPTASTPQKAAAQLPAWPTPFTSQVQFQLPSSEAQAVHVTDALGRLVTTLHSRPDGRVQWQPQTLAPGVYFARPAKGGAVFRLVKAD